MAAIVMFELFCAVGLAFMVRFLIALCRDEGRSRAVTSFI